MTYRGESRKEFLTRITKSFKNILSENESIPDMDIYEIFTLTEEQADFLKEYELWLTEFNEIIIKVKTGSNSYSDNVRLMNHVSKVENHKPILEKFMEDPIFAAYFNHISSSVTNNIII